MITRSTSPVGVLTVRQVADYLQLTELTIRSYIRSGRLPASKLGKSYRIRMSDVELFLERTRQHGPEPVPARQARVEDQVPGSEIYVGPPPHSETTTVRLPNVS